MKIKAFLWDFLFFLFGSAVYSVAVLTFLSPNEISPGGVTGIAIVLNYLFSLPLGLTVFIINIPILVTGFFKFGKAFILKTAVATACVSVVIDIFELFLPSLKIDLILASVFGGSLMGLGISIIMLRGSTTGGVDIIAKIINERFPYFSVGKTMLFIDAAIIALTAIVYKNAQSALYSIVTLYASAKIMDLMLYGADKGKIVYIISEQTQDIVYDILHVINRGVTIIDITGGYKQEKKQMIMCTVRRNEVHTVYKSVRNHDNKAFIVVAEAGEIYGKGFEK
ncbi:MAG: YitT family protein [Clostridia bacterium]|nr:YitT family protein [Clostridia bacterium]